MGTVSYLKGLLMGNKMTWLCAWSLARPRERALRFAEHFHNFISPLTTTLGFPVAQTVKKPPAVQKTLVRFLCWEDSLEKEPFSFLVHSGFLAWRIPWTEEPGGLQSIGSQRVGHDLVTNTN
ncbi:unnamed protein product [Rangifer tarandus platyrhynchus]|uniref:Uncharacterized protein n=2 Tax=Rangifer tarandus platyrhynchus TaxID=3082113 RepID=A0ABN8Z3Q3_RANTA|nr:unnamed protein product [Rangifer tarandus platyrhynchus]